MKRVFFIVILFFNISVVFAQRDSSYLPLKIGNYWELSGKRHKDWLTIGDNLFYYLKIKIKSDTTIGEAKKYFVVEWKEEFIDTVTVIKTKTEYWRKDSHNDVYRYFPEDGKEYLYWKFSGSLGDVYTNKLYPHIEIIEKTFMWIRFHTGLNGDSFGFMSYTGLREYGVAHQYGASLKTAIIDNYCMPCNPLKVEDKINKIPERYFLAQNYPNPFNPSTNITYTISEPSFVTIKIFDIYGREIETLVNDKKAPGIYSVDWCPSNVSSGVYYYQLRAGKYQEVRKMVYIQ